MKRFSLVPVIALALFANACEKHEVSELPAVGATAFGEHAKPAGGEEKVEAKPAAESAAPAPAATPAPESKPGEAPKFFPENK